ncbi:MAG: flavin reductase family protein [Oscillospiraceae bacterium]
MAKVSWRGGTLLAPVPPALITCSDGERSNVFTVAWTGTINTMPPKTYISVRSTRYSYDIIKKSGKFVINLTTEQLVKAADFCGARSGRDLDKFKEMELAVEPSPVLGIPMLCDSPVSLECKVFEIKQLGSHDMFMADIVGISVDDRFIDVGGKLRMDKARIVAFAHGSYYGLGSFLGSFGFSVMKKKTAKRKNIKLR